jgi:hypothetical protein
MGQKQSKGGKGEKPSKGGKEEAPAQTKAPAASTAASSPAPAADKKKDVDWESPVLFADNDQKVGVEDFELLKVIGKGSFGKVSAYFPPLTTSPCSRCAVASRLCKSRRRTTVKSML